MLLGVTASALFTAVFSGDVTDVGLCNSDRQAVNNWRFSSQYHKVSMYWVNPATVTAVNHVIRQRGLWHHHWYCTGQSNNGEKLWTPLAANEDGRPSGSIFNCTAKDCGMTWTTNHNKAAVCGSVSQSITAYVCCRRIAFGHRAFSVAGLMVWNSLPTEFHDLSVGLMFLGVLLRRRYYSHDISASSAIEMYAWYCAI